MKKILHVCLAQFYIDGYSYQENILPREHKKLGYEVKIVTSTETFIDNNKLGYITSKIYFNEDGIEVTRLPYRFKILGKIVKKIRIYKGLRKYIDNFSPDIIFIHDTQFYDIKHILKYAKKKNVIIYSDCHADFSNSARNWLSKNILHKIIYRKWTQKLIPYVEVFWGVLPARVDFLRQIYKVPTDKTKLLEMGSEEGLENIDKINELLEEYNKDKDSLIIVTGGKIDSFKKQTLSLMRAVSNIKDKKIKLIIFGSISKEIEEEFNSLLEKDKVIYVGWIKSKESYNYFAISDLVVFPGRHSVFWEQVVGQGKPLLVKYWDKTTHINHSNNVEFLYTDELTELEEKLREILLEPENLNNLKNNAMSELKQQFIYSEIAKKSIGLIE